MGESRSMIAGLYDLEETIGEGHYAVVKLARWVHIGSRSTKLHEMEVFLAGTSSLERRWQSR